MTSNQEHIARIRGLDESWKAAAAWRDLDGMLAIMQTMRRSFCGELCRSSA